MAGPKRTLYSEVLYTLVKKSVNIPLEKRVPLVFKVSPLKLLHSPPIHVKGGGDSLVAIPKEPRKANSYCLQYFSLHSIKDTPRLPSQVDCVRVNKKRLTYIASSA